MSLVDWLDPAEGNTGAEVVHLEHQLAAILVIGPEAKAAAVARIAARHAEREREAQREAKRAKREALGRSNARPGRRGGAA